MLYYLIYVSKAAIPMTSTVLSSLVYTSRCSNEKHALTGMLLYVQAKTEHTGNGRFIQVLEGNESNVKATFKKILIDERHHQVNILNQGALNNRNFSEWQMGFETVNESKLRPESGYFELNNTFFENFQRNKFNFALNLLKSFYDLRNKFG